MSSEELIKTAKGIVTSYSKSDWDGLKSILTPDAVYDEVGSQRRLQGPDAIVQALQGWKKAMTDSKGGVTNAFASESVVALEIGWEGTHNGPLTLPTGTVPASGRKQKTPAAMIVKFQGNKVKEIHHYFDMVSFLQQIGAMPGMATRA